MVESKVRITVLLCVNMDGSDKRLPSIIGKSKKPQCFKGSHKLEIEYTANLKTWMTHNIVRKWLSDFDKDMRKNGCKVCLLLDNCSAHYIEDLELTNVELQF